jgi:hypothetical protein
MARLVLAAQFFVLVGLAWTMQSCCCGVAPPKPGPPGAITGLIHYAPNAAPADLAVYAIDQYSVYYGQATYVVSHVSAADTSYSLVVPPGIYFVVARLDSDPLSSAGYTFHMACSQSSYPCGANATDYAIAPVRVDSTAVIAGIDVGDWGTLPARRLIWDVDMYGSPASLVPHYSPSPKSLASHAFPAASADPTQTFTSQTMGLTLQLPVGWHVFTPPLNDNGYFKEAFFANETVTSPLGLDSNGIWLATRLHSSGGCPFPDWRYATARATVKMQGGSNHFFFEDPQPRVGSQPFTGSSVRGGDFVFGNCAEFIMSGTTQQALDDNLPAFAALVETAQFAMPCLDCATPNLSPSS